MKSFLPPSSLVLLGCIMAALFSNVYAQCFSPVNFTEVASVSSTLPEVLPDLTAKRDTNPSRPYLYVAGKAQGLLIYDISTVSSPLLVKQIGVFSLGLHQVMNLTQAGDYLYLALGDHWGLGALSGMAIVDISSPASASVVDVWDSTFTGGAGDVGVQGNHAYLAAMGSGIIVLDILDKSNIRFVSVFKPDISFPSTTLSTMVNARTLKMRGDTLFLCYDAGGIRAINTSDKSNLYEIGAFCNPAMSGPFFARAYNGIVLDDTLAYAAVDYAGMEVINIKDPSSMTMVSWWNPWGAGVSSLTWYSAGGHTNEIAYDPQCKMVFMSGGETPALAVSVANPAAPDSCSAFHISGDTMICWGLSRYQNQLLLGFIRVDSSALYPNDGNWGGFKILEYDNACAVRISESVVTSLQIWPNPATDAVTISTTGSTPEKIQVFSSAGTEVWSASPEPGNVKVTFPVAGIPAGVYLIRTGCEWAKLILSPR